MRLSQVRTESSPTGTSGRTSSIRGSHPSSLFRIFRVIPRTTRHSRPLGPRCSRTYSQRVRISSVLLARRPGIPEYGQAFTTPWTMWLVVTLGTRWPQSSSCGQVATVHSESMEAWDVLLVTIASDMPTFGTDSAAQLAKHVVQRPDHEFPFERQVHFWLPTNLTRSAADAPSSDNP